MWSYIRYQSNRLGTEQPSVNITQSVTVLCVFVLVCKGSFSKTAQLVSVLSDDADGERLIQLGQTFNNSMLELVGHAFENLEKNWCAQALSQKNMHAVVRLDIVHCERTNYIWISNTRSQMLVHRYWFVHPRRGCNHINCIKGMRRAV